MIVFGPVPSRRLGRSLGINNIPPKKCSYSCIYCQVGNTDSMTIKRREYFSTDEIVNEVKIKIDQLKKAGKKIDYLTFVSDGEPTLDINLGETIERLKIFGIKIAVITNSSLITNKEVRDDLMNADWVSVKIDSVYENIWRKINRPHGKLNLIDILEGIEEFAVLYKGTLVTETMLVSGVNDGIESLNKTVNRISTINPAKSYILVPTRPPCISTVRPPSESSINTAYQIYSSLLKDVEFIAYNEGTEFCFFSDAASELLSILAVHPMRKDAVERFISKSNSDWGIIKNLVENNFIQKVEYNSEAYFLRKPLTFVN